MYRYPNIVLIDCLRFRFAETVDIWQANQPIRMIETQPQTGSLRPIWAQPRVVIRDNVIVHLQPPANIF